MGFVVKWPSIRQGQYFFQSWAGVGSNFWSRLEILRRTMGGCPNLDLTPPTSS